MIEEIKKYIKKEADKLVDNKRTLKSCLIADSYEDGAKSMFPIIELLIEQRDRLCHCEISNDIDKDNQQILKLINGGENE